MVTLSTVVVAGVAGMTLAQFVAPAGLLYLAAKVGTVDMATTLLPHRMALFPAAVEGGLT